MPPKRCSTGVKEGAFGYLATLKTPPPAVTRVDGASVGGDAPGAILAEREHFGRAAAAGVWAG